MADKKEYEAKINISANADGVKPGVDQATKQLHKLNKVKNTQEKADTKAAVRIKALELNNRRSRNLAVPKEIRDLQRINKIKAEEVKLLSLKVREQNILERQRKKTELDEKQRARRTFGGGFKAGLSSRLGIGGGGGGGAGGLGGALGGALGGGAVAVTAMAAQALMSLLRMPLAAISSQYEAYQQYGQDLAKLAGYAGAGATKEDADTLRKGAAAQLGFTPSEVIQTMAAVSRATGSFKGTESALALSRLTGQSTQEVAGTFGALRQAGNTGFEEGGSANKQIVKALALGVYTGLEKARMPEFLQGVTDLTTAGAAREAGDVSSTNYARLLATLGATKASGMQGARGAAVARSLEEGFQAPGGGEEGQAMMLAAMGFGGGASYYEAKRAQQRGTAGDPNFVKKSMQFVNRAYGGPGEEANLAIEAMLGGRLSLDQIEEVQKAMASGKSQKEIDAMIREAGATELDVMKEIRDLLSGGDARDKVLLEQSKRSVGIQNENITAGDAMNESLEAIQDVFRDFIQKTLPAVETVLRNLANLLVDMRPVLESVAEAVNNVAEYLPHTGIGGTTASGEKRRGTRGVNPDEAHVSSTVDLASELINRDPSLSTEEAFRQAQQIEQNRAADAAGARTVYASTTGGSDFSVSSREQRGIEQAEIIARARGFGTLPEHQVDNRVDTNEELRMLFSYITAQGMAVPPEFTALVARYGGEGAP
jgi:hypothetical protein